MASLGALQGENHCWPKRKRRLLSRSPKTSWWSPKTYRKIFGGLTTQRLPFFTFYQRLLKENAHLKQHICDWKPSSVADKTILHNYCSQAWHNQLLGLGGNWTRARQVWVALFPLINEILILKTAFFLNLLRLSFSNIDICLKIWKIWVTQIGKKQNKKRNQNCK